MVAVLQEFTVTGFDDRVLTGGLARYICSTNNAPNTLSEELQASSNVLPKGV